MTYLHEMHQRFGYLATWLPNAKLELGDVGVLRGEEFRQKDDTEGTWRAFHHTPGQGSARL
jgi:hypothetical protein